MAMITVQITDERSAVVIHPRGRKSFNAISLRRLNPSISRWLWREYAITEPTYLDALKPVDERRLRAQLEVPDGEA